MTDIKKDWSKEIGIIFDKCESPIRLPEQEGFDNGKDWAIAEVMKLLDLSVSEAVEEFAKKVEKGLPHFQYVEPIDHPDKKLVLFCDGYNKALEDVKLSLKTLLKVKKNK